MKGKYQTDVENLKDLGVMIEPKLNFTKHVDSRLQKAKNNLIEKLLGMEKDCRWHKN